MSNFSKIHFSVANHASVTGEHNLVPRLHAGSPENLAERYDDLPWQTPLTKGTLYASLDEIRRTLLHLMANGSPVTIPFLGTFTLTLGGDVHIENGHYQGHNVHVDGIRFTPDADFLRELRALSVDQDPLPLAPYVDDERLNAVLDGLFGDAADTASSAESRTSSTASSPSTASHAKAPATKPAIAAAQVNMYKNSLHFLPLCRVFVSLCPVNRDL